MLRGLCYLKLKCYNVHLFATKNSSSHRFDPVQVGSKKLFNCKQQHSIKLASECNIRYIYFKLFAKQKKKTEKINCDEAFFLFLFHLMTFQLTLHDRQIL